MTQPASDPVHTISQLAAAGRETDAIEAVRAVLRAGPGLGDRWSDVLALCERLGDEDAAAEAARLYGAADPSDPRRVCIYAEKLSRIGAVETALKLVSDLSRGSPGDAAAAYFKGVYLSQLGRFDDAEAALRAALSNNPALGDAWVHIGAFRSFRGRDDDVAAMEALSSGAPASPAALYALGKAYDDNDRPDDAFAAWTSANKALMAGRSFRDDDSARWGRIVDRFEALTQTGPADADASPRPIFVVGAPRTGTTLVEQILGAHPGVAPLGESLISRVAAWPLRNLDSESLRGTEERNDWPRIAQAYRALAGGRTNAPVITDKAAALHLFVGALVKAMPDSRIIWVRRRREPAALSNFRAYFAEGKDWSANLKNTVAYLEAHDALMRRWRDLLPDHVTAVDYESLVTNPDEELPRLQAAAGLSPNKAVERFHEAGNPILTASIGQARRPITDSRLEDWRRYERHIAAALQE